MLLLECRSIPGLPGCTSGCVVLGLVPLCTFRAAVGTLLVPGTAPEPSTVPAQNSLGFPKTGIPQLPPQHLADSAPQALPPQGPKFLVVIRNQFRLDAGALEDGAPTWPRHPSPSPPQPLTPTWMPCLGLQLTLGELGFIAAIQV